MSIDERKTINHAIDELERIREDLSCLQDALQTMDSVQADTLETVVHVIANYRLAEPDQDQVQLRAS